MKYSRMIWLLVGSVQLAACASNPQLPVSFGNNALTAQSGRVGVAMTALPKVDTAFPGASCLLCLATASAANSSLTKHTHALTADELLTLKDGIAENRRRVVLKTLRGSIMSVPTATEASQPSDVVANGS